MLETYAPGRSLSLVARQHGIAPNQLFSWRRLYAEGALSAVSAGEEVVVPASDYRSLQHQVREPAPARRWCRRRTTVLTQQAIPRQVRDEVLDLGEQCRIGLRPADRVRLIASATVLTALRSG